MLWLVNKCIHRKKGFWVKDFDFFFQWIWKGKIVFDPWDYANVMETIPLQGHFLIIHHKNKVTTPSFPKVLSIFWNEELEICALKASAAVKDQIEWKIIFNSFNKFFKEYTMMAAIKQKAYKNWDWWNFPLRGRKMYGNILWNKLKISPW